MQLTFDVPLSSFDFRPKVDFFSQFLLVFPSFSKFLQVAIGHLLHVTHLFPGRSPHPAPRPAPRRALRRRHLRRGRARLAGDAGAGGAEVGAAVLGLQETPGKRGKTWGKTWGKHGETPL